MDKRKPDRLYKLPELRQMLEDLDLNNKGRKPELIDRIFDYYHDTTHNVREPLIMEDNIWLNDDFECYIKEIVDEMDNDYDQESDM